MTPNQRILDTETDLLHRGWSVWPDYLTPKQMEQMRGELLDTWEQLGCPDLYHPDGVEIADKVVVNWVGLTCCDYLSQQPEAGAWFDRPELLALIHHILGEDCVFEAVSGVLCSPERDFVPWHTHNGGMRFSEHIAKGTLPKHSTIKRIVLAAYTVPLGHGYGEMLVHNRKLEDSPEQLHPSLTEEWPGQAEIVAPAGSLLILEQTLWHSVRRPEKQERRAFQGAFIARRDEARDFVPGFDTDMPSYAGASPEYEKLLERGQAVVEHQRRGS